MRLAKVRERTYLGLDDGDRKTTVATAWSTVRAAGLGGVLCLS